VQEHFPSLWGETKEQIKTAGEKRGLYRWLIQNNTKRGQKLEGQISEQAPEKTGMKGYIENIKLGGNISTGNKGILGTSLEDT